MTLKEIINRDKEIRELKESIQEKNPLIVIVGPRMIGTSSILRHVLSETNFSIYITADMFISQDNIQQAILRSL